jgi:hypothetical protein
MPTYTVRRKSDGILFRRRLSFQEYDAVKAGEQLLTDEEGELLELVFDPGEIGFVLKDGQSGGWATKAGKENKYRKARRGEMARRERDHVFKNRLVPNVGGVEAPTWKDAQDEVRRVKGLEAASTYDSHVAKEQTSG